MRPPNSHPSLYQINTRTWVRQRGIELGRAATLDDISDTELDDLAACGFDWIYLLGVWQTGESGRQAALQEEWLRNEARLILPDVSEADICSSCFAVQEYRANPILGGEDALNRFRQRLHQRGLRLMLDFVPNHTAIDHPWVFEHPEFYVNGGQDELATQPQFYIEVDSAQGKRILAHGRDPYFPAWRDTLQLNYSNPDLHEAMTRELSGIAARCDGLRCDMAMLLLPGIIERVWGIQANPFWPPAITQVHKAYPGFVFLAEVYWGLEWTLLQQGFDYAYGKELYDRVRNLHAHPVSEYLQTESAYRGKLAYFLENHDEQRAASVFTEHIHPAAAIITYLNPGLRFFHQGQLEGYMERVPMQLCRAPVQRTNGYLQYIYHQLLECLQEPLLHHGRWQWVQALPYDGAGGDPTWEDVLAWSWAGADDELILVVVNYSQQPGRCILRATHDLLPGRRWRLDDLMGDVELEVSGDEIAFPGIPLSLPAWGYHVFKFYLLS